MPAAPARPLSALLSQVLVAFTLELDNEFEIRMRDAGFPGAALSMTIWSTLLRFLCEDSSSVRDLAKRSHSPETQVKFELGCLERWAFITLEPASSDARPIPARAHRLGGRVQRDGWGSARGIRSDWTVCPTAKGRQAIEIWPPMFAEIEIRWQNRFGAEDIGTLRRSLEDISTVPPGAPLPELLWNLLQTFAHEFKQESPAPLWLCANTLRVLSDQPIPESDIPRLTGCSPETSGIGWQIKPYIVVESAPPPRRGKLVRLSPLGLIAQQTYVSVTSAIETRWETRFGKQKIGRVRNLLSGLFVPRNGNRLLLAEGLIPAEGTVRSGVEAPALGRRDIGPAAKRRMRDRVAQTALFIRDPAGTLPHYPLWDMNRGFGP